ncbi:MAG: amidohydrolase family protein [Nitrospinae bacterium]|nr:amidohydrolase family protein [Nitrospinota bacterium]
MITRPTIPGPDPDTKPPKLKAPQGAVDCHFHVFGPEAEYPYAEPRRYTPPQALESDYRKMAGVLGLARGVVVQASPYGADNARVLEAIRVLGPGYLGVGVVEENVSEVRLDELSRLGIRGARINSASGGRSGIERMSELAAKIKGFGWHMQFHIHAGQLPEYQEKLRKLPTDVVFDHMGLFPADLPLTHPDFRLLLRLLESGNAWVKLSGAERISRLGFPYRDAIPIARALLAAAPERVLWGTDWPHTNVKPAIPNDGDLMDLLAAFAPDERVRRKILVENPCALYGFEEEKSR